MSVKWAPEYVRYEQQPFKRVMRPMERPVEEGAGIVTAYRDGTVTLRSKRRLTGYTEAADLSSYQGVCRGDLVVHGLDILAGAVGVSDSDGAMSAVCTVCQPLGGSDPRFVAYVIRSQAHHGFTQSMARGIRQRSADFRRWETLADLPIPCPAPDVQRRVADFLDAETIRIDTLIDKNRQAVDLGRERLAAETFSLVHGQGIETHEPVDLPWIDSIPASWDVVPLSYVIRYAYGHPFASEGFRDEGAVPVIRIRDILPNRVQTFTDEEPARDAWVRDGDIVVGMDGDFNHVRWQGGPAALNQRVCKVTSCDPRLDDGYLNLALQYPLKTINDTVHYTTVKHLSFADLLAQRIPLPSITEQGRIASEIDGSKAEVARLEAALGRQIELLGERRQALITAAVTGQLDI